MLLIEEISVYIKIKIWTGVEVIMNEDLEKVVFQMLSHSGVAHDENPPGRGSGRYPYGSGKRPFQGEKKVTVFGSDKKSKKKDKNVVVIDNAEKDRILKSGTAKELQLLRGHVSNDEYERAINRLTYERRINELTEKEKKDRYNAINSVMDTIGMATTWGWKSIDAYNLFASVYNATSGKDDKLPVISRPNQSQGPQGKKKKG